MNFKNLLFLSLTILLSQSLFSQSNYYWVGRTFDFKDTVEIGGGYKSVGYSNVLIIIKTKSGLAYGFGIPSGQSAVTRSGNEIFLNFKYYSGIENNYLNKIL